LRFFDGKVNKKYKLCRPQEKIIAVYAIKTSICAKTLYKYVNIYYNLLENNNR